MKTIEFDNLECGNYMFLGYADYEVLNDSDDERGKFKYVKITHIHGSIFVYDDEDDLIFNLPIDCINK